MGYHSQVVLAISPDASHAFMAMLAKSPNVQRLCADADTYMSGYASEGDWFMHWPTIKWCDGYPEVITIKAFIDALDSDDLSEYGEENPPKGDWRDHFRFIRIGEEQDDIEDMGHGFHDIYMSRQIMF